MLLMRKYLQEYVGVTAAIGSANASDSWLLTPDFCWGDERSRNVIDAQGSTRICRCHGDHWLASASDSWLLTPDFFSEYSDSWLLTSDFRS
jgi:hypothetical protein